MATTCDEITVTDAGAVRTIQIMRPDKRNALTRAMYAALADALSGAAAAGNRAVCLLGTADCFTAGNDLGDFARADPNERSGAWTFLDALVAADIPIVAAVNGPAVGVGTTMLLHFDLVYCSAGARFQLPFVNLGLCPEAASTRLLPARAGALRAAELLMLGDAFDAATAQAAGIVNAVLPTPAEADATARSRAAALADKPADALRTTRHLLRAPDHAALLAAMSAESAAFTRLLHSPDAREAIAAFHERRAPRFHGQRAA